MSLGELNVQKAPRIGQSEIFLKNHEVKKRDLVNESSKKVVIQFLRPSILLVHHHGGLTTVGVVPVTHIWCSVIDIEGCEPGIAGGEIRVSHIDPGAPVIGFDGGEACAVLV